MVALVAEEAVVVGAEADLEAGAEVDGKTRAPQSRWVAVCESSDSRCFTSDL